MAVPQFKSRTREMRADLGAERGDLIALLRRRLREHPHLQMRHADRAELRVREVDDLSAANP